MAQNAKKSDISLPEGYELPGNKRTVVEIKAKSVPTAKSLSEYAKAFDKPACLPQYSDVIMRSLPVREGDKNNTFKAMDNFHVTRLEWTMSKEDALITKVLNSGRYFGGMFGSLIPASRSNNEALVNLNGEPIILKHMRGWKVPPRNGCVNNPDFIEYQLSDNAKYIKAGATSIQRDDPETQSMAINLGGCFCPLCVKGFSAWLKKNISQTDLVANGVTDVDSFDYKQYLIGVNAPVGDDFGKWNGGKLKEWFKEFQKVSNIAYLKKIKAGLDQIAGKHFPLSGNNTSYQSWGEIHQQLDYGFSEMIMQTAIPERIYERSYVARSLGKMQVYSNPKALGSQVIAEDLRYNTIRRTIATAYSTGSIAGVPWDTYEQTASGTDRYFGTPEQYADLYGFVRGIASYLDKYEDVCATGKNIAEQKLDGKTLVGVLPEKVYAFTRAIPNDSKAAIVMHLVNWNDSAKVFTLELNKQLIAGNKKLKMKILTPAEYSLEKHAKAEAKAQLLRPNGAFFSANESVAYVGLVNTQNLKYEVKGDKILVKIPELKLWNVLVISTK
jgi:hypothetical protein